MMLLMGVLLSTPVWARSGLVWGGRLLSYWRGLVGAWPPVWGPLWRCFRDGVCSVVSRVRP